MNRSPGVFALAACAAVALVVIALLTRRERRAIERTVDDVEDELAGLDPVARATVVGELTRDAVKEVKAHRS